MKTKEDDFTGKIERKYGFRTDRITRPLILAELQEIFKENIQYITDIDILKEALVFIKNEKGRPEAQEGCHDDLIMGTAITYYISSEQRTETEVLRKNIESKDPFFEVEKPKIYDEYGDNIEII